VRFDVVWQHLPWLLKGAGVTLELSALSIVLALVIGLGVALLRESGGTAARILIRAYVDLIRGTPLLVQLFLVFYVLPRTGLELSAFQAAVLALSLNSAAYVAEILRGGLLSVPRGQIEASRGLGISGGQTMRRIVLPQLAGVVIPPLANEFVKLMKGTSVVSVLAVIELTRTGQIIINTTFAAFEIYGTIGVLYFALSMVLLSMARRLEHRLTYYR
jgi:His/Glu/Gln/Arg/opine family amino acid ABC transporter permease subunit